MTITGSCVERTRWIHEETAVPVLHSLRIPLYYGRVILVVDDATAGVIPVLFRNLLAIDRMTRYDTFFVDSLLYNMNTG